MTTAATLHPSLETTLARRPASGLTFGALLDVVIKAIVMAQSVSDRGHISARDVEKVRRMAEKL
ncbi:hypothetical protein [Noviherbaspirillum denitrificans]|uniref:Uncharacterized protein n=1 Tax=Noviherbaspirillum denitrificans TaxID=1968433 RepID=A0A254TCR2_9BURK|nr:hypothetical protein [Noviherbaspirillum denitrificans]OWW20430.1 hypothetical protein AYR66_13975 [Noviherbaspirillum denitrificans]